MSVKFRQVLAVKVAIYYVKRGRTTAAWWPSDTSMDSFALPWEREKKVHISYAMLVHARLFCNAFLLLFTALAILRWFAVSPFRCLVKRCAKPALLKPFEWISMLLLVWILLASLRCFDFFLCVRIIALLECCCERRFTLELFSEELVTLKLCYFCFLFTLYNDMLGILIHFCVIDYNT